MCWLKKIKFWKRRRDAKADLEKQIEELHKQLEECEANQEQSEAILVGLVEEKQKDLEQQIIDRAQGEAKLRGHIIELEEELKERDEMLSTAAKAIMEVQKNLQLEATRREKSVRLNDVLNRLRKELEEIDIVVTELEATNQLQEEKTESDLRDEVHFYKMKLQECDFSFVREKFILNIKIIKLNKTLQERDRNMRDLETILHRRCQDLRVERDRVIRFNKELVRLQKTNRNNKQVVVALKELSEKLQDAYKWNLPSVAK
jgi:hypothetical protein